MRLLASSTHHDYTAYYVTVATVFSFLFIALNVQFFSQGKGRDLSGDDWKRIGLFSVILVVLAFDGVVIPLLILAGYWRDTTTWRLSSLIVTAAEMLLAVIMAAMLFVMRVFSDE